LSANVIALLRDARAQIRSFSFQTSPVADTAQGQQDSDIPLPARPLLRTG
jgi:hypothetical protein